MVSATSTLTHRKVASLSLSPDLDFTSPTTTTTVSEHAPCTSCHDDPNPDDDDTTLTTQLLHTMNSKLRQIEDADTTGILRYVDDQVHETWDTAKAAVVGAQRLLRFEELPPLWQENKYVLTGYRFCTSSSQCLRTIFMLHNETMNIWSHLIGFVFFAGLGVYTFNFHLEIANTNDRLIFLCFFLAAAKCLVCSTIYHTFICHHKHHIKTFAATLDYIGITALITASVLVMEYYGFYCSSQARLRYMILTATVGSAGIVLPFFPWWDTPKYRRLRIVVFLTMGATGTIPLGHLMAVKGFSATWAFVGPVLYSVLMYLTGVAIYANRFPEKMFPGRFDWAGMTSHAIWHVFVCLGIYYHYRAALHFHDQRLHFHDQWLHFHDQRRQYECISY